MIRIALLGDIHANYPVFNSVLDEINKLNIDKYMFLGDYILDGFDNNKVLDLIKKLSSSVVMGNKEEIIKSGPNPNWYNHLQYINFGYTYDNLSKDNMNYIKTLPIYLIEEIEGIRILISHGTPYSTRGKFNIDDNNFFDKLIEDFDCNVYVFAHTHLPFFKEYKNRYFINPGSVGMPSDNPKSKYGILTINNKKIEYEQRNYKYDYDYLENYYKNSEYYKVVGTWAQLSLMNIKYGRYYTLMFINRVYKLAEKMNIGTKDGIPNDLWIKEYNSFIKDNDLEKYV